MLARSKDEIEQALREAEQIRAGADPATATTAEASPASASGHGTQGGADEAHHLSAPQPEFEILAEVALRMCDLPFTYFAGPGAALPEPIRTDARRAWVMVIEKYLPAAVAQSGPVGALAGIYLLHAAAILVIWQTRAPSSGSSGNGEAANQPS